MKTNTYLYLPLVPSLAPNNPYNSVWHTRGGMVTPLPWPYPPPAGIGLKTPYSCHPKGCYHAPPFPLMGHVSLRCCHHSCIRIASPSEDERTYAVISLTVEMHAFNRIAPLVRRSKGTLYGRADADQFHRPERCNNQPTGDDQDDQRWHRHHYLPRKKALPGACLPVCFAATAVLAVAGRREWRPAVVQKNHRRKRRQRD